MEQKYKRKTKRILSGVIAASMTAAMFPAFPAMAAENTHVYSFAGYDVEYSVTKEWDNARTVEVKVTNTGDKPIKDWAFSYNAGGEISSLWNAAVSDKADTTYIIKNNSWNYEIEPQESVNFGYTLTGADADMPEDFKLLSDSVEAAAGFDIQFNITESWDTGVKGEIVIINTQESPIDDWRLEFDSDLVIDKLWDGKMIGSADGHYSVACEKWTSSIPAGGSQTIGFTASKSQPEANASNFALSCSSGKIFAQSEVSDAGTGIIDDEYLAKLVSDGTVNVIRNENGEISTIDGKFTDETVNNEQDAANVLNHASGIFSSDFTADAEDISVSVSDDETFYRYAPSVNGIKVYGGQIILAVRNSEVTGLTSSYDRKIEEVNLTNDISDEHASQLALDSLMESVDDIAQAVSEKSGLDKSEAAQLLRDSLTTDAMLVVYSGANSDPELAWVVSVKNKLQFIDDGDTKVNIDYDDVYDYIRYVLHDVDNKYFICANGDKAGQILYEDTNKTKWTQASAEAVDLLGVNRSFSVEYKEPGFLSSAKYRMKDTGRNIETYTTSFIPILGTPLLPGSMLQSKNNTWTNAAGVSAHANMEKVYDFYNNNFGWDSFDGEGALIKATVDYRAPLFIIFGNTEYYNAFWNGEQFVFGDLGDLAGAVDVVGHEYTHAVIDYKVFEGDGDYISRGLEYKDEPGALNEAYADILGTFAEGKTGADKWLLGEDSLMPIRSMEDPSLYDQPENYNDRYTGDEDNGGVHYNSGIINFAAYKMMTDERTQQITDEEWANVFYMSLNRLTTTSDFLDARGAILCTAKTSGGFNFEQLQAVKDAFDSVGVTEPDCIHIVLSCPEGSGYLDSHLTGPAVNSDGRFHVSFLGRNYYQDGTYMSDNSVFAAELAYDDSSSYCHEITSIYSLTPGDYCFYLHDYANREETRSTALSKSGAVVSVYRGSSDTPMKLSDGVTDAVFTPTSTKTGNLWSVFWIHIEQNGEITIVPKDNYSNHIWAETIGD